MGVEALHIAFGHEHPIYLYGQHYMGVTEAYLGAGMFHLFGISLFSLRLGMLLLFTLSSIFIYLLARLLFEEKVALLTLFFMIGGTEIIFPPELMAVGGAVETLVCGSFLFWIACLMTLYPAYLQKNANIINYRYCFIYGLWGLVSGLGLWSHLLVVPFLLISACILVFFCWRDLRSGYGWLVLVGFFVGISPVIVYNLSAPIGMNTLAVFWNLHNTSYPYAPTGIILWLKQLSGTFFDTLPMATGMPPVENLDVTTLPLYGQLRLVSVIPILLYGSWSLIYLSLLFYSTRRSWPAVLTIWKHREQIEQIDQQKRQLLLLPVLQFSLAVCAWLTIISYVTSTTAAERPWSFRYLIGLLITLPIVLAQLFPRQQSLIEAVQNKALYGTKSLRYVFIILLLLAYVLGSTNSLLHFFEGNVRINQQTYLLSELDKLGVARVYSGYWVCDSLVFQSKEKVICAVLNENLQPGLTRYAPYQTMVERSKDVAYIFTQNSDYHPQKAIASFSADSHYTQKLIGAYIVFIPRS